MAKQLRIGYISTAYTSKRNFLWATENRYVSLRPFYRLTIRYWLSKLFKKRYEGYHGNIMAKYFYDVAHFFNTISFDCHPWITTGGGPVPWLGKEMTEFLYSGYDFDAVENKQLLTKGVAACASKYCKHIFLNSYCSLDIEKALLSNFPQYKETILSKTTVLYPPQELIISSVEEKVALTANNTKITFIFVGHDFYRKGGLAVLRCFERLSSIYNNFKVITIGLLRNDVPDRFGKDMEDDANRIINLYNKPNSWLTHYYSLKNEDVLYLIKTADIGLLPTYSDVFGYSCLEFQACACPVISSDVRALPEINNNECGWLMEIGRKTPHRELANIEEVIQNQEMENKLYQVIENILKNEDIPKAMIQKCIDRIQLMHSPAEHKKILTQAYQAAVK